jgi:glyoxylase-like metal-dependent hydrolase (beta-lactamase superfamily II)
MTQTETGIPGIHQLKVPIPNNPLENTNVYLVHGDGGHLLIDAGWNGDQALQSLRQQLSRLGIGFGDISRIVVTHAHRDHYGLAGRLRQLSGASVSLHQLDRDFLSPRFSNVDEYLDQAEAWFRANGVPDSELSMTRMFISMRASGATPMPDTLLADGDSIQVGRFSLQVVWTPGHSPGHICLYEPQQKVLFAGDHILPVITPNISLQPLSPGNPLADFLASLKKVREMDVRLVLPAHEHIFEDLPRRVDEIVHHHELRNLEILEAIKAEPMTAYRISSHITWMPELGGVRFEDLEPGDRRMAISETLAHLEAMAAAGRVTRSSRDGITYYQRH